jgi:hypothetical protein
MTLVFDSHSGSRSHRSVVVTPATIAKVAAVAILVVVASFVSQSHAPGGAALNLVHSFQTVAATFGPLTISDAIPSSSQSNLKGPLVLSMTTSQGPAVGAVDLANTFLGSYASHLKGPLVFASAHS